MKTLALIPLLAAGLAQASASGSYRAGIGCPENPRCADVVTVAVDAPRGAVGAIFVAIAPTLGGEPAMPAGWFLPSGEIEVVGKPTAALTGPIGPFRQRYTIRGGVCAVAHAHGVTGDLGLFAGYGISPPQIVQNMRRLDRSVLDGDAATGDEIRAMLEKVRSMDPIGQSAAQDMIARGNFWKLATIRCGERA